MSETTLNPKFSMRRREVVSLKFEELKSKKRVLGNISNNGVKSETDINDTNQDANQQSIWNIFSKKERRNLIDNQTIINYLQTMTEFVDLIKRSLNNDFRMVIQLLTQISFYLDYEKHEKDKLLFKLGDKGEKFYIILKGSVDVLIPKNRKVRITELDYLFYLANLHHNNELDLLKMCLQDNINNYKLDFTQVISNKPTSISSNNAINTKKNSLIRMSTFNRKMDVLNDEIRRRFTNLIDMEKMKKNIINMEKENKLKEADEDDENDSSLGSLGKRGNNMNYSYSSDILSDTSKNSDESCLKDNLLNIDHMKKTVFNINQSNQKNFNDISSIEYINKLKVFKEITDEEINHQNKIIEVIVYEYTIVSTLNTGSKFGDIALNSQNKKRSASIITREDCHFAILDKEHYLKCIHESNEKVKKANLNFLLGTSLIKDLNKDFFEKKYYNYFNYVSYDRKFKLFNENEKVNKVYFLKEGEYDVTMNRSLYELTEVIKYFVQKYESLNLRNNFDKFDKNEKSLCNMNPFFKKFYHTKRLIRIRIIKGKDIIGLEDVVMDGKCLFNIEGISIHSELFSINKNLFEDIHNNVYEVTENTEAFTKMKINLIIEKLKMLREVKIASFLKSSFNGDITLSNDIKSEMTKANMILNKQINTKMFGKFDLLIKENLKLNHAISESNYNTIIPQINRSDRIDNQENFSTDEKLKSRIRDFQFNPKKLEIAELKLKKSVANKERGLIESFKEYVTVNTRESLNRLNEKKELPNVLSTSPRNRITKSKINFLFKKIYENNDIHIKSKAVKNNIFNSTQNCLTGNNTERTDNSNILSKLKEKANNLHTLQDKDTLSTNENFFNKIFQKSIYTSSSFHKTHSVINKGRNNYNIMNHISIDNNSIDTSAMNFYTQPLSRDYNNIKEMKMIGFNLNNFHFQENAMTDRGIIHTDNGYGCSNNHTNENVKTRNHSQTASNIMNTRAKIFYSPLKIKILKKNRYTHDYDTITRNAAEMQERKKDKIIKQKESDRLIRAKQNMYRFCKKIRIDKDL